MKNTFLGIPNTAYFNQNYCPVNMVMIARKYIAGIPSSTAFTLPKLITPSE